MQEHQWVYIRIDTNRTGVLQYERGKAEADAEAGYPPTDSSPKYREGYADGQTSEKF